MPRIRAVWNLAFGALAIAVGFAQSQTKTTGTPKFEVASIKPCKDGDLPPASKRGGAANFSPGTLHLECATVKGLIQHAYVLFANGQANLLMHLSVDGGPGWINSERYRIDAKAEGPQSQGTMHGPMLQALLEDRFKLKIHRETREVPAYALTVAKGGPKLHPFQEGSCTPIDLRILERFPPVPFPDLPLGQTYCGGIDPADGRHWVAVLGTKKGPNEIVDARALSIDDFIKLSLNHRVDRPVINQTGISGRFDYHLEFAPEATSPEAGDQSGPGGPSLFTAIQQQLGLKLEPAKSKGEFLVIDRVEKPSGN
jgi:uncharacterized protein (TIGR03435 family)